jgi:hypothetical protein
VPRSGKRKTRKFNLIPRGAKSDSWFLSRIFALSKAWQKLESGPTVIYYDRWYKASELGANFCATRLAEIIEYCFEETRKDVTATLKIEEDQFLLEVDLISGTA